MVVGAHDHWDSPRLALDGIRNLRVEGAMLVGEGWYAEWKPVRVDLAARRVLATAHPL